MSKQVAKGEEAHENLERMLGEHIKKDDRWKEDMASQVTVIAQALLQDQARDDTEKEAQQGAAAKKVAEKNKWLTWKTTVAVGGFAVLANIGEVVDFFAKLLSLMAE